MRARGISSGWRRGAATAAALASALLAAGCDRSQPASGSGDAAAANRAAPAAPKTAPQPVATASAANGQGPAAEREEPLVEEEGEKRGPTRKARCQIDDEPEQACDFTPLFGDGSFDIRMPDHQLRLTVDGDEAAAFELIGARRIPLPGLLRRDPADRACWVAQDPGLGLQRVCAR